MRLITCPKCGVMKPTHPDDAARGLHVRYVRGKLAVSGLECDLCEVPLNRGEEAVAITQPATIGNWETEYFA